MREIERAGSGSEEAEAEVEVEVVVVVVGVEGREVDRAWSRSWEFSAVTIATRAPERISGRKAVGMSWP